MTRPLPLLALLALLCGLTMPALAQHEDTSTAPPPTDHTVNADHAPEHADPSHSGVDEHGQAHGEQPSLLSPDLGSAVWSIVLFVLLLIVLGKFVWPPILNGLKAREQRIRDDIEQAARANADAKQTLAQYESKLAEAQADARKTLEQARQDADELRARLTAETEQQITQMRKRATEEIRLAKQQAVQDLYAQTAQLATAVAGKILQRQINADDADRLVEQSLDELQKMKAG